MKEYFHDNFIKGNIKFLELLIGKTTEKKRILREEKEVEKKEAEDIKFVTISGIL